MEEHISDNRGPQLKAALAVNFALACVAVILRLGSRYISKSKLLADDYNIIVISPTNYFLFTPLLPSVTVGTLNGRSITQPTRHLVRYKKREVQVLEAEATQLDIKNKLVTFEDKSDIAGSLGTAQIPYDYLVYAVGSQNQPSIDVPPERAIRKAIAAVVEDGHIAERPQVIRIERE